jgi:phosphate transport system substrate-binding protein
MEIRWALKVTNLYRGLSAVLLLVFVLVLPVQAESLLVGGTGSASPLISLLIEEFNKQAPNVNVSLVSPPLGSGGGMKSLLAGRIDLAVISRPVKEEEKVVIGRHFELGRTPLALFTNGGQRRSGFTLDELASIYEGRLQTWDNNIPIRLVLRTRDDSDSLQLKSMSAAMEKAVGAADQRQGMVRGLDDLDTIEILARTRGSLGPSNLGLMRTMGSALMALPINGVTPSVAALKDGRYPWYKVLIVVLPVKASPAAEKFADFMHSSKAGAMMLRYEFLPASQ